MSVYEKAIQLNSETSKDFPTETFVHKKLTLLEIYRKFYTDSIIDRVGNDCSFEDFIMGVRHTALKCSLDSCELRKTTTNHYMSVTKKYLLQAKAIQIGLIANEWQYETLKTMKENIEEMRKCFWTDTGVKPIGREIIERIITKCIFTKEYDDEISNNFQSIVPYFAQGMVGGDEKWFLFLGTSRYSRTTARNMGLWFNESCCLFNIANKDISFLLHFSTETTVRQNTLPEHRPYPQSSDACDNFNAGLRIFTWPHKRRSLRGGYIHCNRARHNNFVDAAILQNTYNAFCVINEFSPSIFTFELAMITLAIDLYKESLTLNHDNDRKYI